MLTNHDGSPRDPTEGPAHHYYRHKNDVIPFVKNVGKQLAVLRNTKAEAASRWDDIYFAGGRFNDRGLKESLRAAAILTEFDAEGGVVPCSYDELIMRFAENSRGGFDVECVVQTYEPNNTENKRDTPYKVCFLFKGRLYCFWPEDRGDWYDVEAVDRAVNFALETAGRS
jgi:hypothetical protein